MNEACIANPANLAKLKERSAAHFAAFAEIATFARPPEANDLLLARLIHAAMRACDYWGDSAASRAPMRQACIDTPPHLRADLLEHFRTMYSKGGY